MANTIAIAREQKIFVGKESTRGTAIAPATCSLIIAAGYGSINQQPSFTNSPEIQNSRDILDRFQDRTPPGDWSFPVLLRPSGTAGTAPMEDALMECLLGTKAVVALTSVAYTPALVKPSFTLWMQKDHTVFGATGCTVGTAKAALAVKGAAQLDLSGKFMKMVYAGTDTTNATEPLNETAIVVTNAKKFSIGAYVEFVESAVVKNNTGAGYKITNVVAGTNTLTITPGLEEEITTGSVIRGFLPTGTEVGAPVENRLGVAKIAGSSFNVTAMDVNVSDDPQYLEDEITTSGYTEDYAETLRNVSGSFSVYFRENDTQYFYDAINNVEKTLSMVVGTTAGKIITIYMGRTSLSVPQINEQDPTIGLNVSYQALGTNGEDSISITYT
jgi:hypothetical protein